MSHVEQLLAAVGRGTGESSTVWSSSLSRIGPCSELRFLSAIHAQEATRRADPERGSLPGFDYFVVGSVGGDGGRASFGVGRHGDW